MNSLENARIGVIGLGYVGLPLAVAFASQGRDVVAVDIDRRRIDDLRAGRSYVEDVSDDVLARRRRAWRRRRASRRWTAATRSSSASRRR